MARELAIRTTLAPSLSAPNTYTYRGAAGASSASALGSDFASRMYSGVVNGRVHPHSDEHPVYISFSRLVEEFAQNLCSGPVAL